MKFGKRRKGAEPVVAPTGASAPPPAEPAPVRWAVADTPPPAARAEPEPEPDTVVDAESVELPSEEAVAEAPAPAAPAAETARPESPAPAAPESARAPTPAAAAYVPPPPAAMPFPVVEQPVIVASSGSYGGGVTPLSETGPAYASGYGHATGTSPSWPEPVMQLADERPEVVVGAAFVGGLLLAAILRRLGN